jgi:Beta-L-arabinofuranosidase, GH127
MGSVATDEPAGEGRTIRGIPVTARNARSLGRIVVGLAWPPNALVVARNLAALGRHEPWRDYIESQGANGLTPETLIDRAVGWICRSQDRVGSGGVGDLEFRGWTPGYPEVTGYIIPTFWDLHAALGREELAARAIRMTDWELGVQKDDGGIESLYEGEGQPAVAFNTGQVIRGLLRTHEETGEQRYLDAAVRAGDWMVAKQEADGSWTKANYLGMKRTYDTFAAAALALLSTATADERYARAALTNCEFTLRHQLPNGWFELCDNTVGGNDAPITHTLCYASAGLIEVGEALREEDLVAAGERTARAMMAGIEAGGYLPGRFDREWRPSSGYSVLTGCSQLGGILLGMHARQPDPELHDAARRLLDFVAFTQDLNTVGEPRSGGIAGSFPIWGRYIPFKYPSWATKFFVDHLLSTIASSDRRIAA